MRHLVVIVAVICAVIGDGWAQNRGSARYAAPDEFEEEITRAPRPTRGGSFRRQRPTKAPEPTAVEDELKAYQPPEIPPRTTGRRVPQRGNRLPITTAPPLPAEEPIPRFTAPVAELPPPPAASPEEKAQGNRRRRPKKRRRPQNAVPKAIDEPEKPNAAVHGEEKKPISELLNEDKKRTGIFQSNPTSRNSATTFNADPAYPEKAQWENNPSSGQQNNVADHQYYGPQPAVNRLPVANPEHLSNSRGYLETPPAVSEIDTPSSYIPKRPLSSVPNDGSYVPVLSPIRVPSDGASRLPPENHPGIRHQDTTRYSSDTSAPPRGHNNISPIANPEDIIRNTGVKPVHNVIPQADEPSIPVRSHSETRLPESDQPHLTPQYIPPSLHSTRDFTAPNAKASEDIKIPSNPSNRLPNPSEIHYESVYPEFSDDPTRGTQRIAGRRQESDEHSVQNPRSPYSTPRRDIGTKPRDYDNDAEVDRHQVSQYRPPLQRTSSRYKPEDSDRSSRVTPQEEYPSTSAPRTRGSARYQSPAPEYTAERTRSSSRTRSEPSEPPTRSRSSSSSRSTTSRGSQRNEPEKSDTVQRTNPRGLPPKTEELPRNSPSTGYVPVEEFEKNDERTPSHSSSYENQPTTNLRETNPELLPPIRNTLRTPSHSSSYENQPTTNLRETNPELLPPIRNTLRTPSHSSSYENQPTTNLRKETNPELLPPIRNTLRSRPQYDVREADPNTYEESVEEPDVYRPDYYVPQQVNPRERPVERAPVPRAPPPQPEYNLPPRRQQNRQETQYETPQNPRSRQQSQYQAPQNPRVDSRQANNRQIPSSPRQQGRSRQQSEPTTAPRNSADRSNFRCPDAFGFFGDSVQCDKYYECRNGTAEMHLCSDGLAFNDISAPNFLRCDSIRDVDCKSRPELQEPQPTKNCPRKFGLFPHETDCTRFWNCVDGTATEVQCPPGLTYSDDKATCDWADLSVSSCKSEDLLGFTCPEPTAHDLVDGVFTRYPHPDNCQLHFTCIKGADGTRRPRMLSCTDGLVFDPTAAVCKRPEEVPGCEKFYGDRSEAPARKPARQPAHREPEPEPEELYEEPTPRPRRRGSNRRIRN